MKDSRKPTAKVMRAVYIRDRGRCRFVGPDGRKCGERAFLEFDHYPIPFAAGGRATVDNLQLRCRAHNQYLAKQFFGRPRLFVGGTPTFHIRTPPPRASALSRST